MMRLALRFLIILLLTTAAVNAQQLVIGVGTTANDGTGDPARTAFQKVNTNFTAVFLNVLTVSNTVTANTANITTVSNSVGVVAGNLTTVSNSVGTVAGNLTTVSNAVTVNTGNLTTVSNSVGTVAANLTVVSNSLTTVSNSLTGKINAQTGTTYAFVAADAGKLTTFTNAAAVAVTLAVFTDGTVFHAKNIGAGVVTITPTGATIDFAATLILTKGQSASIFSDGTNYRTTLIHPNLSGEQTANVLTVLNPKALTTAQQIDVYQTTDAYLNPTNYARLRVTPSGLLVDEVGTGSLGGIFKISRGSVTRAFLDLENNGHWIVGPSAILGFTPSTLTLGAQDAGIRRKSAAVVTSTSSSAGVDTGQFSSINGLSIGSIFTQTADAPVGNTVTETSILGTGSGTKTVAAGAINTIGRTLRIQVRGMISVNVGSPTLTVRFKIQGVTISTGVVAVNAASSNAFSIDELVTTRTTGSSGTFASNGEFSYQDTSNGSPSVGLLQPGTSTTDLTTSKTIDVTVQWSAANALSTITSQVATIEILN
jgi:hypothetical protein